MTYSFVYPFNHRVLLEYRSVFHQLTQMGSDFKVTLVQLISVVGVYSSLTAICFCFVFLVGPSSYITFSDRMQIWNGRRIFFGLISSIGSRLKWNGKVFSCCQFNHPIQSDSIRFNLWQRFNWIEFYVAANLTGLIDDDVQFIKFNSYRGNVFRSLFNSFFFRFQTDYKNNSSIYSS